MAKRKLTWIDIAVIAVIIVSIAGIAYKFSKAKVAAPTQSAEKLLISFYVENAPDSSVRAIKTGDPVTEYVQGSSFGRVKEITTGDSIFWECGADGQYVASGREGYSSVELTMEAEGVFYETGVSIGKSIYNVGQSTSVYAGSSTLTNGRISKIVKAGQ